MVITVKKTEKIWTVIHSRPEVRNAMDPISSDQLYQTFVEFDKEDSARVAVLSGDNGYFCAGYDLRHAKDLNVRIERGEYEFDPNDAYPKGPMGPTRLQLKKPIIAAIAGPAVAGGMELALWANIRVMEKSAYFGVYCRRWGIPLIDGGTVRLPRIIGEGRAMDIVLTGRKVSSEESYKIGLCEYLVEDGKSLEFAEALALNLSNLPQSCMRSDMISTSEQNGVSIKEALKNEWLLSKKELKRQGLKGADRFVSGKGRHGQPDT